MTYHLSTKAILSTLHALAALQALACGDDERAVLAPILCRERTGLLNVIIVNAFTEVLLGIGQYVVESSVEGENADDGADLMLMAEIVVPSSRSASCNMMVRRALEQSVALTALRMWCMVAMPTVAGSAALAESFATVAGEWHATLRDSLASPMHPTIRSAGVHLL